MFMVRNVLNIFMEHDLNNILMIFGTYTVLLVLVCAPETHLALLTTQIVAQQVNGIRRVSGAQTQS